MQSADVLLGLQQTLQCAGDFVHVQVSVVVSLCVSLERRCAWMAVVCTQMCVRTQKRGTQKRARPTTATHFCRHQGQPCEHVLVGPGWGCAPSASPAAAPHHQRWGSPGTDGYNVYVHVTCDTAAVTVVSLQGGQPIATQCGTYAAWKLQYVHTLPVLAGGGAAAGSIPTCGCTGTRVLRGSLAMAPLPAPSSASSMSSIAWTAKTRHVQVLAVLFL